MMRKTVTSLAAVALAVGVAAPAYASNEVRIKLDPLNWEWDGTIETEVSREAPFAVQPGGGPQQVHTVDAGDAQTLILLKGNLQSGNTSIETYSRGDVMDPPVFNMFYSPLKITTDGDVDIQWDFSRQQDPTTLKTFYELKFFPDREAPTGPPADLALQNLHQVQDEGVAAEDCTVSRTLEPGDTVSTGDGNDTVCVTVSDGDGSSDEPITVETGDGNDTVLIDGDTDAPVEVDTGRGNDVVVADADAQVSVDGGGGHDAAVIDEDDTFDGGDGNNETVTVDNEEEN